MQLFEYMIHPYSAFTDIYNYKNISKGRGTGSALKTSVGSKRRQGVQNSSYFENLYDNNRINLYAIYREMMEDPLVAAVLDSYSKSCVQPNMDVGFGNYGRPVWCQATDGDVQKIVDNFLINIVGEEMPCEALYNIFGFGESFEGIPGHRGEGILKLEPYEPWEIAVIQDEERNIRGYGPADTFGNATQPEDVSVNFWEMLHFRMPRKNRIDPYGARSSILYNVREYWQDLQWIMDKITLLRLWLRPQRQIIALDVAGNATEEAFEICEEWRHRMYHDLQQGSMGGELQQGMMAWGEMRDIILPKGRDNNTTISTAPASSTAGPLDDLYFFLRRFFGAMRFPPGVLGLDLGNYKADVPLENQDSGYAQNCMIPQRKLLLTLTQAAMVHLSYFGINAKDPKNAFILMATPVSNLKEMEHKELMSMRFSMIDEAMRLGQEQEWNMDFWTRYVMREYGNFSDSMIEELLKQLKEEEGGEEGKEDLGSTMDNFDEQDELLASKDAPDITKRLQEAMEKSPKLKQALHFCHGGAGMASSASVMLTEDHLKAVVDTKTTDAKKSKIEIANTKFESKVISRLEARRQIRKEMFEGVFTRERS